MPSDLKPVAWQRREMYPETPGARPQWESCSEREATDVFEQVPGYEYRPLYTRPPVAQQEAQGLVERVRAAADGDHKRGCEGRCYACTCGYDEDVALALEEAAALITAQASQLEEARKALDRLAKLSEFLDGEPSCVEEVQNYVQFIARDTLACIAPGIDSPPLDR